MTKKRPLTRALHAPDAHSYRTREGLARPQDLGMSLSQWIASGGATSFLIAEDEGSTFDPITDGAQLVCSQYIPRGTTGWIKQIRVGPFCPPVLAAPWQGWPDNWPTFAAVTLGVVQASTHRAPAQNGIYTTPFGWESYFDATSTRLPEWFWSMTFLPGTIDEARKNANTPPFSASDPTSWFLVENIAVPASLVSQSPYSHGLPGRMSSAIIPPQKMQVQPGDAVDWHVLIPEDTTALLWARWRQSDVLVRTRDINTTSDVSEERINPILPSYGQLAGYMQSNGTAEAIDNATLGG